MVFKIDDIWLARSLHKLLHKLKFYAVDSDSFTPHAAYLSNSILNGIIEYYLDNDDIKEAERWREWRVLDRERPEFCVIVDEIRKERSNLKPLSNEERLEVLKIFYSPFKIDGNIEAEFIKLASE